MDRYCYMCWVQCSGQIGYMCPALDATRNARHIKNTASPTQREQAAALSRRRQLRTPCYATARRAILMLYLSCCITMPQRPRTGRPCTSGLMR